ncbi:alpha-1-antitrypsin-like protein GS55-MS [Mixophyes fleayi]|uniref:alpha-1-antitrypsin-like protein GS55-MS n=1 Tax=Mixophyes fleayi TaxID=3061075 RepID=UPI003F4DDFA1
MKVILFWFLSQALFCTLVFAHHLNGEHHDDEHDDDHHKIMPYLQIAPSNARFSYKLYSQLAAEYPDDNILFSPLSISLAFSMLSLGAKSQTHTQILEGLGFNTSVFLDADINNGFKQLLQILNRPKVDQQLSTANALFVDQKIQLLEKFSEDVKNFYQSEAISTDFQNSEEAKNQINSYVEKKTNGLVKDLLDSLDQQTVLVLINTIFFGGTWEYAFNENFTREEDFHVDENTVMKVPMMTRQGEYLVAFIQEPGCVVVDVPYKGNTSAIFILPDAGKLHDVEKALQNVSLQTWTKLMRPSLIRLSVPKFTISATLDLKEELSKMGIKDVFSDNADLSGITGAPLKVSKAVHKAVLKVHEKGAEAAAATAVGITKLSLPQHVNCNRPFIFTIIHKELYSILFTGRVVVPVK